MKKMLLIIALLVVVGCATPESIYRSYTTEVDVVDGVTEIEAKIIAKYNLLQMQESKLYKITAPVIYTDSRTESYPKYWFVAFGPNWFAPMSKGRDELTYKELNSADYLIVIDKDNGDVVYSGLYYHTRADHFDWIFDTYNDPSALRFELPPGRPGTKLKK